MSGSVSGCRVVPPSDRPVCRPWTSDDPVARLQRGFSVPSVRASFCSQGTGSEHFEVFSYMYYIHVLGGGFSFDHSKKVTLC